MSSNVSTSNVVVEENTNMIGFDPDAVRKSLNQIQVIYNELVSSYVDHTSKFMYNMSYSWACPDAVDFFRNVFCPEFNSYYEEIWKEIDTNE